MSVSLAGVLSPYVSVIHHYHIAVERRGLSDVDVVAAITFHKGTHLALVARIGWLALGSLEDQLEPAVLQYAESIGVNTRTWHYLFEVSYAE